MIISRTIVETGLKAGLYNYILIDPSEWNIFIFDRQFGITVTVSS